MVLFVSACAANDEAPLHAQISKASDAPGYIVIGLATQSYQHNLEHLIGSIEMVIARRQGGTVIVTRYGCGNVLGYYGSRPCDLTKLERHILMVAPGDWLPINVVEKLHTRRSRQILESSLPFHNSVHVDSGEVVYLGDFIYASDYDMEKVKLIRHVRNDAAAIQALAGYPGLRNASIIYRDPT